MKKNILLSTLADLHVAYVGNGASVHEMANATLRVRHIDATSVRFGETFEETLFLNFAQYNVLDDFNTDKRPLKAFIPDSIARREYCQTPAL